MKKIIAFSSAALLLACSAAEITTPPIDVTKTAGFTTQGMVGMQAVKVRSYSQDDPKNAPKEMPGANCKLQGSGYFANLVTPAVVNVPNYNSASQPITIHCTLDGKSSTDVIKVTNKSAEERSRRASAAGAGFGIVGAVVSVAASAAVSGDRPGDTYGYPDTLSATFRP